MPFNTAWAADAKSLVIVIGSDVGSLDPDKYTNWNDYWAYGNMFEGLYRPNEKGDLVPGLAESVEVSPDGLTYRFRLRAGAKFHNGDPVTSDDVIFSINRSRDPAIQNQRASLLDNIAEVVRTDDRQFTVRLKAIDAETIPKLSLYWQVKPKRYIEAVGNADFAKKPVGTGPFEFAERTPAQFLKMRAFPGYWGTKSSVAEVTIKIAPEEQSRIAQVMAGEADVATPISPVLASRMGSMPALQVVRVPSFLNVLVYFNTLHTETTKPDVRRALVHGGGPRGAAEDDHAGLRRAAGAVVHVGAAGLLARRLEALQVRSATGARPPAQGELRLRQAVALRRAGARTSGRQQGNLRGDHRVPEAHRRAGQPRDPGIRRVERDQAGEDEGSDGGDDLRDRTRPVQGRRLQAPRQHAVEPRHVMGVGQDARRACSRKMNSINNASERNAFINKILRRLHEEAYYLPLWANDTLFVTGKSVKFDVPPYLSFTTLEKVTKTA